MTSIVPFYYYSLFGFVEFYKRGSEKDRVKEALLFAKQVKRFVIAGLFPQVVCITRFDLSSISTSRKHRSGTPALFLYKALYLITRETNHLFSLFTLK